MIEFVKKTASDWKWIFIAVRYNYRIRVKLKHANIIQLILVKIILKKIWISLLIRELSVCLHINIRLDYW